MNRNSYTFRSWLLVIAGLLLILGGASRLTAQSTTGSIVGHIADPSKALVTGAGVTAVNQDTGVAYKGESNGNGDYVIYSVPPGTYTVSVEKTGFDKATIHDVVLAIDHRLAPRDPHGIGVGTDGGDLAIDRRGGLRLHSAVLDERGGRRLRQHRHNGANTNHGGQKSSVHRALTQ